MRARSLAVAMLTVSTLAGAASAQDGPGGSGSRPAPTALEFAVVEELNRARTDPAGYAVHLEALLAEFQGTVRRTRHGLLQSREGAAAVREAIAALRSTAPMPPLSLSAGLSAAARDLVRDQAESGGLGHRGSDGSSPADRVGRYGQWGGALSENVSYNAYPNTDAREVVTQLLVDDGVPGRGHRRNILDPTMRRVGVSCGRHPTFPLVCVMDHARDYEEAQP